MSVNRFSASGSTFAAADGSSWLTRLACARAGEAKETPGVSRGALGAGSTGGGSRCRAEGNWPFMKTTCRRRALCLALCLALASLVAPTKVCAQSAGAVSTSSGGAQGATASSGGSASAGSSGGQGAAVSSGMGGNPAGPSPEQGIALAGWMFYPSFFAGAIFNDNVYNAPSSYYQQAALGVMLNPALEAQFDNGLHQLNVFVSVAGQIYPGLSGAPNNSFNQFYNPGYYSTSANNVQGRAGARYLWSPMEDLRFGAFIGFSRQLGLFGGTAGGLQPTFFSLSQSATTPTALQQYSNQITGGLSAEKKLTDRIFLRATGGVQAIFYDNSATQAYNPWALGGVYNGYGFATQQNGVFYYGALRSGFWVTPLLNAFVEVGGDLQRYQNWVSDANGYRAIAGVASDMIGLFRGQIYGGYQSQSSAHGLFGTASAPAFGGSLSYFPTPYATITASASQTLGAAAPTLIGSTVALNTFGLSQSLSTRIFQASLQGAYAFSPYWNAYVRGGYSDTHYTGYSRLDRSWSAGAGVNYLFWRNYAISLSYQHSETVSEAWGFLSASSLSFRQNLVMAGVTYRY